MLSEIKNLYYITYQSFPSEKANTLQTISNIKYLVKAGVNVSLFFPLREKTSSGDLSTIQSKYSLKEEFFIYPIVHNLPFGKVQFFNSFFFLISHFLWSRSVVKNILKNYKDPDLFFTRSEWIFYFLSKHRLNVIFECHQFSKLRNLLMKMALKSSRSKVVFLNDNLYSDFKFKTLLKENFSILHNGVDYEYFQELPKKNNNEIVFVGGLQRFGESRDIEFIIESLNSSNSEYKLKIIGGSTKEIQSLKNKYPDAFATNNISISERLSRSATIEEIKSSEVGLLINSDKNIHSTKYTSPLKYFEYLAAKLKIIAVDFDSHRKLPFSDKIVFFKHKDSKSFIDGLNELANLEVADIDLKNHISLEKRVNEILELGKK